MSENLSDAEWMAEQTRRFRRRMDDLQRGRERSRRRVLDFISSDVWELWPTLITTSAVGGLVVFDIIELLVHYLSLTGACR